MTNVQGHIGKYSRELDVHGNGAPNLINLDMCHMEFEKEGTSRHFGGTKYSCQESITLARGKWTA
jgi:hypothetical protein